MSQRMKFLVSQKLALLEVIRKYKEIIECKRTDAQSTSDEDEACQLILNKYNSECERERTLTSIKNFWSYQKTVTLKNYAALKLETYRTGGGINSASLDIFNLKTLEILQATSVERLNNSCDSDAHENISPNDPENENSRWKKWKSPKLKTRLSAPLERVIDGSSGSIASQNQASQSEAVAGPSNIVSSQKQRATQLMKNTEPERFWQSYQSTKAEVFNLMKQSLIDKQGLEKELLQKKLQRENLKLKLLERQFHNQHEHQSSSDSD